MTKQDPTRKLRSMMVVIVAVVVATLSCSNPTEPTGTPGAYTFDYTALPSRIASLDLGSLGYGVRASDMDGEHLVLATWNSLTIIGVADPFNPVIRQSIEITEGLVGVAIVEDEVLVLGVSGLTAINLNELLNGSAPASTPTLTFDVGESPTFVRMEQMCFVATNANQYHYLYVLDVGDPAKPVIRSKVTIGAEITDVAQELNLVMVGTESGAVFLDVQDVDNVRILSTIGRGQNVALGNGFAYVNGNDFGHSGVTALDIHDPQHPIEIGSSLAPAGRGRMVLGGSRLFVDIGQQVEVIDVVDRRRLRPAGSIQTEGREGTFLDGDYLWGIGAELVVHQVGAAIEAPVLGDRGSLIWGNVQWNRHRIYGEGPRGFFAMSVHEPGLTSPQMYLPGDFSGIKVVEANRLYAYRSHSTFDLVVNIHDLASGQRLGHLDLAEYTPRADDGIVDVHARDQTLYLLVADGIQSRYEVFVVDVGLASTPRVVGHLSREGDPNVRIRGSELIDEHRLAIVADGFRSGLPGVVDLIDVSRPHQPTFSTHTWIPSPRGRIACDRGYLYVNTADGLAILDARDRLQTRQVALLDIQNTDILDLVVKHKVLYVMMWQRMDILDIRNPERPRLLATRGHLSTNHAEQLFATEDFLIAIMYKGVQTLPLHASR